jgi:Mrp family chromosome partitioning ATPase
MAISIARTFAVAGKRTLLIDADLRNPSVSRLLGHETGSGIAQIIGSAEVQKAFAASVARDPQSGLDVISGSSSALAGSDLLLGSPNFARLLHHAMRKYQAIVIDSPPVGVVVDPLVILPLVDLVVYVVRYARTGQRQAVAGIREIAGSRNARPLVTVLNQSRDAPGGYYYRYGAGGAPEKPGGP